jgi:hypothetical protein
MFDSLQRKCILYSAQLPVRLYISHFYKRPNRVLSRKARVKLTKLEADHTPPNADVNSVLSVTFSWHVT